MPAAPWFSDDELPALRDFWRVFERHDFAAKELVAGAIADGDWSGYRTWLRERAEPAIDVGRLCDELVAAYADDRARLARALRAMQKFVRCTRETRESAEERLRTTLDSIGDAVISTDRKGRIERINPVAAALTGWSIADAVGRPLGEVYQIGGEASTMETIVRVIRGRELPGLVNYATLVRRDGAQVPIADTASAIKAADGEIDGIVLVFRDMTQEWASERERFRLHAARAKAEAALRHGQQTLSTTLANIHEGVVLVDLAGAIIYRNPAAERIAGRDNDHIAMIVRAIDGEEVRDLEILIDGAWLAISSTHIRDDRGEPIGAVASFRDITHRRRLDEERLQRGRIEEASRLKSEFLANMSHELRTPLNAILGFSELLYEGLVGPIAPKQQEFLGDILTSGRHLLQLINDILDLSKVEAGRLELHPERVDLAHLIAEVTATLRGTAAAKHIQIVTQIAGDLGEIVLDTARLKQVLYNYLSNALKFTPEGGNVGVRAEADGPGHVRFTVEDTGIGIAAQDQPRLFVEFEQIHAGTTKAYGGTGLGLALTKRLVEAQGGRVGVSSEVGVGSRFHAVLPRK